MSPRRTFATALRVAKQLSHDHRTMGLILAVPSLLMALMYYLFEDNKMVFNSVGGMMLVIFPFTIMFLISSIAILRERTGGTLERLLALPIGKFDFILGYGLILGFLAVVQVSIALGISTWLLGLDVAGSMGYLVMVASVDAILGVSLGLLVSALARSEFQAVQFMPALVIPQVLLSGLFVPREKMADWLQAISDFLPLTYAIEAINRILHFETVDDAFGQNILIVVATALGFLIIGSLTLRRRTK